MTTLDGSYKNVLRGVSQQVVQERQEGQLGAQDNMVSDPVTGLRRRIGIAYSASLPANAWLPGRLKSTYVELGSLGYNLVIDTSSGTLYALNAVADTLLFTLQNNYLKAAAAKSIRITTMAGSGWILNTEMMPVVASVPDKQNPTNRGFFSVRLGQFAKAYAVSVTSSVGSVTATYTTPVGTETDGPAARAVPEYIAADLVTKLTTLLPGWVFTREGSYVYMVAPDTATAVTVTSSTGVTYLMTSGQMQVTVVSDLPAKLPPNADNAVVAVGISDKALVYYRWVNSKGIWSEASNYLAISGITNVPIELVASSTDVLSLSATAFEGRLAGDDKNNIPHQWLTKGITGLASFQGRLVLLSGSYVSMSGSGNPRRFFRSTVTDIRDDDPIEVSSGATSAAAYQYAIPFNRDLVLISRGHQAVIATNQILTARTAMISVTSNQLIDTDAEPSIIGRNLMYATPLSDEYFGVGELQPSTSTASQYTPQNLTDHIPRYMAGGCTRIVGANAASSALFSSDTERTVLYVFDYVWEGDARPLLAWHRWVMPMDIMSVHYARDKYIVVSQVDSGNIIIGQLSTKTSAYTSDNTVQGYLDMFMQVNVVGGKFILPAHLRGTARLDSVRLAIPDGPEKYEPVGIDSINQTTWEVAVDQSYGDGALIVGWPYLSRMQPTPPMVKDKNGNIINTGKTTLLRYRVSTQNSGEFSASVMNRGQSILSDGIGTMLWSSTELGLGQARTAKYSVVTIPIRAIVQDTVVELSTQGTRELNILDIEYTLRNVQPRGRMF